MNKKGEEGDSHWGTVGGAVLILIALFGLLFFYSDSFAEVKKGFEKVADTEAIKKAYEKTIGKEEALTEEEKKIIDQFNLFFKNNFVTEDDDCIKQINFDEIKGKGFGIGVRSGNVFAEKEERARVYPLIAPSKLAFYSDEITDEFFIDENFENINNEVEFVNTIYIKDKNVYFLDDVTNADFSGIYSDVMKMKTCGDKTEKISPVKSVEGDEILLDYLNQESSYYGRRYTMAELIVHLHKLRKLRSGNTVALEIDNKWRGKWEEDTANYFRNKGYNRPEELLMLNILLPEIIGGVDSSYGKIGPTSLEYKSGEATITLMEGDVLRLDLFDYRKV